MRPFRIAVLLCSAGWPVSQAAAQANANAVAQAADGFGFQSGNETVGLYDQSSVRGFDLEAAGNYRIHGTYFVKNSGTSSFFLENTTVRIGYNTLDIPFPGPLGIVDFTLRDPKPGDKNVLTAGYDFYFQPYAELNLRHGSPIGDFSYSIGASKVFNVRDEQGGSGGNSTLIAATARLTRGTTSVQLFGGDYEYEQAGQYRVVPSGDALPPRINRATYFGPTWARQKGAKRIIGIVVDEGASSKFGVGLTSVVSQLDPHHKALEVFSDINGGTAAISEVLLPRQPSLAWSTELRTHLQLASGNVVQRLDLSARARIQKSRFGGGTIAYLGTQPFGEPLLTDPATPVAIADATSTAHIRQIGLGLSDRGRWGQWLRWNVGVLKTDYRDRTQIPGVPVQTSRASPWLYNLGAAVRPWRPLQIYASFSRGLEEAGLAPVTAANASQLLDPVMVTQKEVGIRLAPIGGLSMIVGWFDTKKPYPAIDSNSGDYRFVGDVEHKGVEFSLAGKALCDLTLVVGAVWIDARVSRRDVVAENLRPLAVPRVRINASTEAKIRDIPGLSVDGGFVYVTKRAAQSLPSVFGDQLTVPAVMLVNLGIRYSTKLGGREVVLRAQVKNLLNHFAWDIDSSETLLPIPPRSARIILSTLF